MLKYPLPWGRQKESPSRRIVALLEGSITLPAVLLSSTLIDDSEYPTAKTYERKLEGFGSMPV